jgi:hypothetical protein
MSNQVEALLKAKHEVERELSDVKHDFNGMIGSINAFASAFGCEEDVAACGSKKDAAWIVLNKAAEIVLAERRLRKALSCLVDSVKADHGMRPATKQAHEALSARK